MSPFISLRKPTPMLDNPLTLPMGGKDAVVVVAAAAAAALIIAPRLLPILPTFTSPLARGLGDGVAGAAAM